MNRTRLTQMFIAMMVMAATVGAGYAGMASHTMHPSYALAVLVLAAATSKMKAKLPGVNGNMSVNLPFLLMAVVSLSAVEAVTIAVVSTVVQCWPTEGKRFKPEQMLFNLGMMAFAASMANLVWNASWFAKASWPTEPLMMALATAVFFFGQTAPVATVIHLAEGAPMHRTWLSIAQMSFPYFVLSAGLTSMTTVVSHHFGWQAALLMFPVMYAVHRSYRLYFGMTMHAMQAPAMARATSAGM
jgi:hypothetical protein